MEGVYVLWVNGFEECEYGSAEFGCVGGAGRFCSAMCRRRRWIVIIRRDWVRREAAKWAPNQ